MKKDPLRILSKISLVFALTLGIFTHPFAVENFPNKPIRLIVPFPPGGGNDVIARVIAQKLSDRLKQQVIVENRAGANGIVGLQALIAAPPDGYTIAVGAAGPLAVNPSLYAKLPYDPVKDFAPITNLVNYPLLLVANPSLPVKNTKELISLAKNKPGTIYYSSPGNGNSGHLAGELFNSMAQVNIVHVPYKGQGPALADLLAGQVQLLYSSIPSVINYVKNGQLNAIAVGSSKRLSSLPDVPTIAESGVPGYDAYSWVGMVAPAGTPKEVIRILNHEIVAILKQKETAEKLNQEGAIPVGDSPEEFGAYIQAEIKKWGAVVRAANIKID
jgi:tripartite-type tricarboxylate transporter receptor subunit TctC